MPQTDRAPNEVAKHFYDKYGRKDAVMMIKNRLAGRNIKQDSEFWLNVIRLIEAIDKKNELPENLDSPQDRSSNSHLIQQS